MEDPGEELVICPYNKAHALLKSRMAFHLTKCRKDYRHLEKEPCPYNSTHVVNVVEMSHHIETCGDRGVVDSFTTRQSNDLAPVGVLPVQTINLSSDYECWDDPEPQRNVLAEQAELARSRGVLIPKIGAPKAERKTHRFNERLRHAALSGSGPEPSGVSRAPHASAQVPDLAPAPAPPKVQQQKVEVVPPDMPEPKFVHPIQPSSSQSPANPWSGGRSNAPQVGNTSEFPTLGSKGSRRDNDNGLQDHMNNLTLDYDRNERHNAWGKPAPRQQHARIAVPAGGIGGGGNRSQTNPWGRTQQPTRPAQSEPAESSAPRSTMPPITPDDFPSLVLGGMGRGKRGVRH